jgi:hypothetical protein
MNNYHISRDVQIPAILMSSEFIADFWQNQIFNQKLSKPKRKKQERFTVGMHSLLLESLQYWIKDQSDPYFERTIAIPSKKTVALVGQRHTKEFLNVLDANGWYVNHSYSTGKVNNKAFCKEVSIPNRVYEQVYDFLKKNESTAQSGGNNTVETSWTKKAIDPCRKDGKQRYHSYQLPNAVRVNVQRLAEYVEREEDSECWDIFEKLQARTLFELAAENDGWINQYYREVLSGRVYGRGSGNLALAKNELLDQILAGCWQLDIQAAAQTLIPQICRKIMNDESLEFDGLEEYAVNRKCLRKQWAEEVGCSVDAIKETVTALLYGSSVAAKEMVVDGRRTLSAIRKILKTEDAVNRFRNIGGVKKMENDTRRAFKLVTTGLMQNGMLEEFGLDKIWMDQATKSEILAMCYQRTESRILAVMVTELQDQVVISKHDGLIILERLVQVDDLENKIFDQVGYRIRLDQDLVGGT